MLVLTRRVNESIAIGDSIVVTVLAIEGDRIKLGITAPREIQISRQEVFQPSKQPERHEEKPGDPQASNDSPGAAAKPDPET